MIIAEYSEVYIIATYGLRISASGQSSSPWREGGKVHAQMVSPVVTWIPSLSLWNMKSQTNLHKT